MTDLIHEPRSPSAFRHEALFYAGEDEFLGATVPFITEGVARDEPVLVVVDAPKIDALHDALDGAADQVQFADMSAVGRNPACIIPAWRDFVSANGNGSRPLRGIGEPINADRSEAALVECHWHESLLDLAFGNDSEWWLLCPYDTACLAPSVVDEARRTHHFLFEDGHHQPSRWAADHDTIAAPLADPLSDPPPGTASFTFDATGLAEVRTRVRRSGAEAGLDATRIADLALAANEVATNSIRHGGGSGVLRTWVGGRTVICDIRDSGRIEDPLVGRCRPIAHEPNGRGLWLANQLCELVQIRVSAGGTVVRLHVERF